MHQAAPHSPVTGPELPNTHVPLRRVNLPRSAGHAGIEAAYQPISAPGKSMYPAWRRRSRAEPGAGAPAPSPARPGNVTVEATEILFERVLQPPQHPLSGGLPGRIGQVLDGPGETVATAERRVKGVQVEGDQVAGWLSATTPGRSSQRERW